jgi:hypothetical protein
VAEAISDSVEAARAIRNDSLDGLPLLLPVSRAAEILGISRSAAYRCVASGDLPTKHLGGRVYVVTAKLQAALSA